MKIKEERKPRKDESLAYAELMLDLYKMKRQVKDDMIKLDLFPVGWNEVEKDNPTRPKKARVTACFDADMVKWFRNMGHGYQARMNAVLRIYMNAIIAKEIERQEDRDWFSDLI